MWPRLQKLLDRLESRLTLWTALTQGVPLVSAGAITAWLSSGVAWINNFGWFGWWVAGLLGALLALIILLVLAWLRNAWAKGALMRKWGSQVDSINPLDVEFTRKRIRVSDLANPISKRVRGKRFIDCELMGPANIVLHGAGKLSYVEFSNCDFIVLTPNDVPLYNVVVLEEMTIIGGTMWECTILLPPSLVPVIAAMGVSFATLTGDPEIDTPQRSRAEKPTRP